MDEDTLISLDFKTYKETHATIYTLPAERTIQNVVSNYANVLWINKMGSYDGLRNARECESLVRSYIMSNRNSS